ncbi:MAG: hypothetical protein JRH19_24825, partial [Deltaproteobacteria bacterium]|nr:hypothetical protein [Deltaproteobacteria bacterium]
MQNTLTGELFGESYIWRPWLATWNGGLGLSSVWTHSQDDSTSLVITGDGTIRIFPQSRFPFEAYLVIQDTRVNFEPLP